jgi:photosystem II stability/assembly factor-like uncharacterized protein
MRILFFLLMLVPFKHAFPQDFKITITYTKNDHSFRGLSVVDDRVAWVSGTNGTVGFTTDGGSHWGTYQVPGYEKNDFRSIYAFDAKKVVIANAGTPANILLTKDGGHSWKVVYTNEHADAFIDGVDFWNDLEGMMYGDPIDKKMLLIRTTDGGQTWHELADQNRPVLEEGEASFAASGTGIRCFQNGRSVIVSGGKISRYFTSADKGMSWTAKKTPIIQGLSTTGIFSVAYADDHHGIIAGGDFNRDTLKTDHVFYTKDAGNTWLAPSMPTGGYRECVEFISDKIAIAAGPGGIDISRDGGRTWSELSQEKQFHVIRKARNGTLVIIAGGMGKIGYLR